MNISAIEAMLADKRQTWSTPQGDLINYLEDLVDEVNAQRMHIEGLEKMINHYARAMDAIRGWTDPWPNKQEEK